MTIYYYNHLPVVALYLERFWRWVWIWSIYTNSKHVYFQQHYLPHF